MKQFIPQTGGHDLRLDDFIVMEQAYSEALEGVLSALDTTGTGTCILSGVQYSGTTTLSFTQGFVAFLGEVFIFNAQTLPYVFGSRCFLKIQQTVITPSSPVPYENTENINVHFNRTMIMKYYNSADGDLPGTNGVYYDSINWAATFQPCMVIEWYPSFAGQENAVFDGTGAGVYSMRGWQICNGLNNSPDLRGQFTFMPSLGMFNPAALLPNVINSALISTRYGNTYTTILTSNMPDAPVALTMNPHTHTTEAFTVNLNPHDHTIQAQSYIASDGAVQNFSSGDFWSNYGTGLSNWAAAWHNNNVGAYMYYLINGEPGSGSAAPGTNISPYTGGGGSGTAWPGWSGSEPTANKHLIWVVDVNTPFDDWYSNVWHSQQPAGYDPNIALVDGEVGDADWYTSYGGTQPLDTGIGGWNALTNTSAPSPTSTTTTNGYEKNFPGVLESSSLAGKIGSTTVTAQPATVVVNNATSTGTGVVQGGGQPISIIPASFSMIKILRVF